MFTQGWLLLAWFLIAVGVATRHAFAFLLGLVVLGSAAASYLWDRYCLARVEYRRACTPRRAFYGETVTFTMEVTNRKPLPLAWLEVVDELPQQLVPLYGRVIPSVRQRRHQPWPLKWNLEFHRSSANARRRYLNSTGVTDLVRKTKLLETSDRTGREKPSAHLWPRKPFTFQSDCINAPALQFPHTRSARKTSTDDDHIVHYHFSATNTRRNGKLRYTRAGTPARSAT